MPYNKVMQKQKLYTGVSICIAIVVVFYFFFINFISTQNPPMSSDEQNQNQQNSAENTGEQQQSASAIPTPTPNSVLTQDAKVGTGAVVENGQEVTVEYVGKLQDGTIFDQSSAHGGTFKFVLGAGQVISGWEQGLKGMKIGGERILIIPPALAYGSRQVGPIPPNSTLIFDIKLVSANAPTPASAK